MPIDIDEFEEAPEEELRIDRGSIEGDVLQALAYNPGKAYTLREIQSATDLPLLELATRLSQLEVEGIVRHKGSYWAIDPDHDEPAGAVDWEFEGN